MAESLISTKVVSKLCISCIKVVSQHNYLIYSIFITLFPYFDTSYNLIKELIK